MDDDSKRQADHSDDPRDQDPTGQGGYPESTPGGTSDDDAASGPGASGSDGGATGAPSPSAGDETDRDQSTGNPDAAG